MLNTLYDWHLHAPGFRPRHETALWLCRTLGTPLWPTVMPHTFLSPQRLRNLERLAKQTRSPGVFMECGCGHGGTAMLLGQIAVAQRRDLWLFDTFEGLPSPNANDPDYATAVSHTGTARGELHEIRTKLESVGAWDRTTAIKGLFQETMPGRSIPPIALLHLDADWYDSTMTCLTHLWPHVEPGACVQIDDYGAFQGCKKAVDEFFGGRLPLHRIDHTGIWLQKPMALY